jgi:sugar phosphate isomerase/epimerase
MPRPIILCSGPWADVALEELAPQATEWGYQGLDLCSWGDHFEVQRAIAEDDYCPTKLTLLGRLELAAPVVSVHRVSQAVADLVDDRHRDLLPDYVWGDGNPEGVRERAAEEVLAAARAAQKLGAAVLTGHTGFALGSFLTDYPPLNSTRLEEALRDCARRWSPILETCRECGLRYACAVRPGQIAFDYASAERALDAFDGRPEFGFALDPAALHWQGVDPVEFVRRIGDRIYHVLVTDAVVTLNGRTGLLSSHLPPGDPRRGWQPRAPGRGGVDWESLIRALNEVGYDGPLAVEWQDPGMSRTAGAEEGCRFVKRLDFDPPAPAAGKAFV